MSDTEREAYDRVLADLTAQVDEQKRRAACLSSALVQLGPNAPPLEIVGAAAAFYDFLTPKAAKVLH